MNLRKIVKVFIPRGLYRKVEPYGHLIEAAALNLQKGGSPAGNLRVIGVTGTNGKTTTCFLIYQMLHKAGYKVGMMTTVGYGANGEIKPQVDHMTTVPVPKLIKRLQELKGQDIEWLVMETTSHALVQRRDWGIPYSLGVLTNMSHEHLDYHGTFERYVAAKQLLFKRVNRNRKGLRTGIVNADDKVADKFTSLVKNPLTYGIKAGELKAKAVKLAPDGISYQAVIGNDRYEIKSSLPGKFNVYNTLAAVNVGRVLGLSSQQIEQGIASLKGVEGRMTSIKGPGGFSIIVDFAHSPDALQNVLTAAKELTKGKILLVFGATGDRDKLKRPVMGEVAARQADQIFLTDDETYTEEPAGIIKAVYAGIEKAGGADKTTIVEDRLSAIKAAYKTAKEGDVVLLTGIGHEKTRNMGGKEEPWDEIDIAKKLLKS